MLFERIAPYIASSPRKVLWLINVYRLIKANDEYAEELVADESARMALITQLVLVSRSPEDFNAWYRFIAQSKPSSLVKQLLSQLETQDSPFASNPRAENLKFLLHVGLKQLQGDDVEHVSLLTMLKYGELAQRYSFALPASPGGHA